MIAPPCRWVVGITGPLPGHTSLAPVAFATFMPWSKLAFHSATASSSNEWISFPSGMPNSSLSLDSSTRFSMCGKPSPNMVMRVIPFAARFM